MITEELRICAVTDAGCLAVSGQDATRFLQAQLSQDIERLAADRAAIAAWHDARGRVRAVLRVLRQDSAWWLITAGSLVASTSVALGRFVLRADAAIAPVEDWTAYALVGPSDDWLASRGIGLGQATGAVYRLQDACWLRLGAGLVHCLGPADATAALRESCNAGPELAVRAEIRLGLPAVDAQTTASYVPQMLNLDRLGAIAFDKGCFPGQEVIARTQNLGTVKRRARIFTSPAATIAVGNRVLNAAEGAVGEVIRVAHHDAGTDLMAVVRLAALEEPLHADDAAHSPLEELPLPASLSDSHE